MVQIYADVIESFDETRLRPRHKRLTERIRRYGKEPVGKAGNDRGKVDRLGQPFDPGRGAPAAKADGLGDVNGHGGMLLGMYGRSGQYAT